MTCRNTCVVEKDIFVSFYDKKYTYAAGYPKCLRCEKTVKVKGLLLCPCCGYRTKHSPRQRKNKKVEHIRY